MRSSTLDAARRAFGNLVRGTVHKTNDKPLMQTVDVRLMHDELLTGVERMQHYGFTSVPLPPSPDGKKAAEVTVAFLNGHRSHPIIVAVDDRRYRLTGLQDGELAIHDDQGQKVHIARGGIVISTSMKVDITSGDTMTLTGKKIVLDGEVHIGGTDANIPASMRGTVDSAGDTDVSGFATKVFLK